MGGHDTFAPRVLAAYHPRMSLMNIAGVALDVVRVEGLDGRAPIVFLHEGLGSISQWTYRGQNWPKAVCRATGRAGVVYSRQGYGQSAPAAARRHALRADYLHREAWEVLPALLKALHIGPAVLLGHSDGATIALLHASRHAVAACIAMAPHVIVETIAIAAITQAKEAFESGSLRERLAKHHADVDGAFRQWNDVWLSEPFSHFDIRKECRQITAPLLLVQGVNDDYGTLQQLDEIARAVPHARQCRLADCGHSPHRDQAALSLQAVTAFLENSA